MRSTNVVYLVSRPLSFFIIDDLAYDDVTLCPVPRSQIPPKTLRELRFSATPAHQFLSIDPKGTENVTQFSQLSGEVFSEDCKGMIPCPYIEPDAAQVVKIHAVTGRVDDEL